MGKWPLWKPMPLGQAAAEDPTDLWVHICSTRLAHDQREVLEAVTLLIYDIN